MPDSPSLSLQWWIRHHRISLHPLPSASERLVFFTAAAELEEASANRGASSQRINDSAMHASYRAIAENRTKAHFKSDNRTAV